MGVGSCVVIDFVIIGCIICEVVVFIHVGVGVVK